MDLLVGKGQGEQELAAVQVVDDVHRLEHAARANLPVAFGGCDEKELFGGRLLDGLGDRKFEVAPQVADGLAFQVIHPLAIPRVGRR